MEASCLELALEGERLCKAGDFKAGAAFFEAAVQVGTEDLKTLSAIYSQLGNAYFYLKEYSKALEYHKHDLTLARYACQQCFILIGHKAGSVGSEPPRICLQNGESFYEALQPGRCAGDGWVRCTYRAVLDSLQLQFCLQQLVNKSL